ncbi:WD40 repeat-containing protein [Synechococcus sp. PCC 7502]|uniref:WD40 domain-containing protein n=1 Tax=Synechococcus sp. PCC 7502 TaxID=1173263 RepID=UPI00029FB426|nr:hypothetical protein [Synechococcus sp. PCC 7502]AFY73151.1 WD40 repeat-containing protein [Synechococcus sp. PCC 7502]
MLDFAKNRILSPKPSWSHKFSDYVTAIAWAEESDHLAIATADGEVGLWLGNKSTQIFQGANNESVDCLSFSSQGFSGNWLSAAGEGGKIKLWNLNLANFSEQPIISPQISIDQGNTWIDFLAWHQSDFAFSLGKYVQVWSVKTQDIVTTVNFENSSVQGLAWHPTGNYLTASGYQSIKIWNAADWDQDPFTLPLPTAITAIAWQDRGQYLVIATADKMVIFLEYQDGEFTLSPFQLRGFVSKIKAISWSNYQTGNTFALASGNEITLWQPHPQPNSGWQAEVLNQHSGNVNALEFQPHSKVLASGDTEGKLYLSRGTNTIQSFNLNSEITCLKWHPQGHKLAVGTAQGEVLVWEINKKSSKGFGT